MKTLRVTDVRGGARFFLLLMATAGLVVLVVGLSPVSAMEVPARNIFLALNALLVVCLGLLSLRESRRGDTAEAQARQQTAVNQLGQHALLGTDLDSLLEEAASVVYQTLALDGCDLLEALPGGVWLRRRAGAGWQPPAYDSAALESDGAPAQAGKGKLVKADPPEDAGAGDPRCALSVTVPGKLQPFGVIRAYLRRSRVFTVNEASFVETIAAILAAAIERKRSEDVQSRLVAILDATTDLVATASRDMTLLYVNRAGREILGIGAEETLPPLSLPELLAEKARGSFHQEGFQTLVRNGIWTADTLVQSRSGGQIPMSQVFLAHKSPAGAVEFFSTVGRDLREHQSLEEQVRRAQKLEAVGRLAGGIAHDFNNLLCIINGYSEYLLETIADGDERKDCVRELKNASDRAAALTRQLLVFSRKQMFIPSILNLNTVLTDMEKMLRRLISEDIELVTRLDPTLYSITADPGQIEQVVMNLVVNARDAMAKGGILTLETSNVQLGPAHVQEHPEFRPGPYVMLAVSDTGIGMPADVQAHIFEPFFTTKEIGKGTGLGLATVYGIIKQCEGHIEVKSAPGRGTTFHIYLPHIQQQFLPKEAEPAGRKSGSGKETILLVEDEQGVRRLARQILDKHGYNILEAKDGQEALDIADAHAQPIDLLLTDVVMPGMNGGELARILGGRRPDMKILFVSGYTDSVLVQRGVKAGEVDCLLKPYSRDALTEKVREVLDSGPAKVRDGACALAGAN
jgi:PAS domain S-box-containing protein